MSRTIKTLIVVLGALLSAVAIAGSVKEISEYPLGERSNFSDRAIEERITLVGTVCVEGEDCGSAAATEVASGPRSGEDVYNASCAGCHGSGVLGAPKVGAAADWAPRAKQGMATLVKHAVEGINAMPPMGGCGTCSKDEIKATVEYMVEHSK